MRPAVLSGFLGLLLGGALATPALSADPAAVKRGKYLFDAGGCAGCHTDTKNKGPLLAGGRELKTPFGVYYSPNITPDKKTGIGGWSDADFLRAMRDGKNRDGDNYFPVFPFVAYTQMTDRDILDLKAYIFSLKPLAKANKKHQAGIIFGSRFMVGPWRALNFKQGPMKPDPSKDAQWNRGRYLVEALGHCGECHTPRNKLGGLQTDRHMAGTNDGPDGESVPNITPHDGTGIGKWSADDLESALTIGMLPDGDFLGGGMGEVVSNSTSKWTKADLRAALVYLQSLKAVENRIGKQPAGGPSSTY
ncbi:MAG: c-type cytochrome [Rhodospirillales bacterium]|nr:c-type cytochrome [Rhodospirillales bacterium]